MIEASAASPARAGPAPTTVVPPKARLELSQFNVNLHGTVCRWLVRHGKGFKPKLSAEQEADLSQVFKLMDEDGSGAIDVDELGSAFQMLGFNLKRQEILDFMAEVDHDGTGELEYNEFLEVMTETLARLAEKQADEKQNQNQVPFSLMTTAYKRKKLMKNILSNTKEGLAQVAQCEQDMEQEAKDKAEKMRVMSEARMHRLDLAHNPVLLRLSQQSQVRPSVLVDLPSDELRVVANLMRQPQPPASGRGPVSEGGGGLRSARHRHHHLLPSEVITATRSFTLPHLHRGRGLEASLSQHQNLSPRSTSIGRGGGAAAGASSLSDTAAHAAANPFASDLGSPSGRCINAEMLRAARGAAAGRGPGSEEGLGTVVASPAAGRDAPPAKQRGDGGGGGARGGCSFLLPETHSAPLPRFPGGALPHGLRSSASTSSSHAGHHGSGVRGSAGEATPSMCGSPDALGEPSPKPHRFSLGGGDSPALRGVMLPLRGSRVMAAAAPRRPNPAEKLPPLAPGERH